MLKIYQFITIIFLWLCFHHGTAQTKSAKNSLNETSIEKWNQAIINLEVRQNYSQKECNDIIAKSWRNEISQEKCAELIMNLMLSVKRVTGTAVYLKHNKRYYLLTARHVIEAESSDATGQISDQDVLIANKLILIQNGSALDTTRLYLKDDAADNIVGLGAALPQERPYLFSSKVNDLAVVYLDSALECRDFVETLNKRGYKPITMNDIDSKCLIQRGQEITSFGFPGDLYQIDRKKITPAEKIWRSEIVSLPVVSRGAIVDPLRDQKYFSGGIFVYPGCSGGPIVSSNKLIGIVSRQETQLAEIKTSTLNYYLNRDLYFVKSSLLTSLILQLEQRVIANEDRFK